jgi:hypothetical protein
MTMIESVVTDWRYGPRMVVMSWEIAGVLVGSSVGGMVGSSVGSVVGDGPAGSVGEGEIVAIAVEKGVGIRVGGG